MSFSKLGLQKSLIQIVNQLGYETPTPIQAQAIPVVLSQKDIMARAQTGTGKTAAFALPIIQILTLANVAEHQSSPSALVLTPTRELAQQVFENFKQYSESTNLRVDIAYGGVSLNPQIERIKQGCDILIATPGRLLDLIFKKVVNLSELKHLVFDEADRMLDMGFAEDINRILAKVPSNRQTMLFSATFDDAIFKLSKTLLNKPKKIEIDSLNTAAETVEQIIYNVDQDRKRELISHLIGAKNWQQVLIFSRTKQAADALASEMNKDGIKTLAIHSDKTQARRENALAEFKAGTTRALVATDVAARGLDIPELKYVINYELPHVPEDYIHRIGRTGRAGNSGIAISLMSEGENHLLEEIELILDTRLPQQWLPGYEPDLTKPSNTNRRNSRSSEKRRAKKRIKPTTKFKARNK